MLARYKTNGTEGQTLQAHCREVAKLCQKNGESVHISATAYLMGLLHDMGKATKEFQTYLYWTTQNPDKKRDHQNHAATGAIYCWEHWRERDAMTAQMIALCIGGHHTGLADCITTNGDSPFLLLSEKKQELNYSEAVENYHALVADQDELDMLFEKAVQEKKAWITGKPSSFDAGAMTRLLLSILTDADRWDSACFDYGEDPFVPKPDPDWGKMLSAYYSYCTKHFTESSEIARIRSDISNHCADKAKNAMGVYSLSVPTGGGKTLSSLRFALLHAKEHGLKRIFYIIPYNTILDQNAADIQEALGDSTSVLVHHSNIVIEDEAEERAYRHLTERWNSEIILTSMVQFLNALFLGKNSNARRMRQLTDAVLIFDEIQALPKRCKVLFEKAIDYLIQFCNCTVILCTATQPNMKLKENVVELIESPDSLFNQLKRVRYNPMIDTELSNQDASAKLCSILSDGKSVLCIVNLKRTAQDIYKKSKMILQEGGWNIVDVEDGLEDHALVEMAQSCAPQDIVCIHLSTNMCPAHRLERLRVVKAWTRARKPILCVSTALIEAGINVSFPVVVRSLAGLPSVIQAGGRCNRNCEDACGDVYIWRLYEEKDSLKYLEDIQNGGNILSNMVRRSPYQEHPDALGMPKAIKDYFKGDEQYTAKVEKYPINNNQFNLVSMLSQNENCKALARQRNSTLACRLPMKQSFRTAGETFRVINEDTVGVLVPYGAGKDIIAQLCSIQDMKELPRLLRKAQAYSVNLYQDKVYRLIEENALYHIGSIGVFVLDGAYYDMSGGVCNAPQQMDYLIS